MMRLQTFWRNLQKIKPMRIEQLTFTRFIAALGIVYFHFGHDTFFYKSKYSSHLLEQANVAVSYFFVLSGFVMAVAYNNKTVSYGSYYASRFARIYPLFLFALLMFVAYQFIINIPVDFAEFLANFFVVQAWIPGYPLTLNFTGWSLSVEFFFYLTFPFFMNYVFKKFSFKNIFIGAVIFWIISQLIFSISLEYFYSGFPSKSHDIIHFNPIMHLNEFLIGIVGAYVYLRIKDRKHAYSWIGIVVCALAFYFLLKYKLPYINFHNGFLAVVFLPLIVFLALDKSLISKMLNLKPFVFLGEISYGIYILQVPVYLFSVFAFERLGISFSFNRYVVVLILFSSFCYILIEKPLRDFINKKSKNLFAKKTVLHGV